MTKSEVEAFLKEFDEALMQAFPGPEPMSVLLVGGACLLLQGITAQPTDSVMNPRPKGGGLQHLEEG
jgi:hypothetical protein